MTSDILSPVQLMRRCLKTPFLVLELSFGANKHFAVIEAILYQCITVSKMKRYWKKDKKMSRDMFMIYIHFV